MREHSNSRAEIREEGDAPAEHRLLEVVATFGDTVLDVTHLRAGRFTIGQSNDVSHYVPAASVPQDPYVLATTDGATIVVHVPDDARGDVLLNGTVYGLEALRAEGHLGPSPMPRSRSLRLPADACVRLAFGDSELLLSAVPPGRALAPQRLTAAFDAQFGRFLVSAVALQMLMLGVVLSAPADADRLSLDGFSSEDRWVEFHLKPERDAAQPEDDLFAALTDGEPTAERASALEGATGRKDEVVRDRRAAAAGTADPARASLVRAQAKARALETANAAFQSLEGQMASVWGAQDRAIGADAVTALGHLFAPQVGDAGGPGGLGASGPGPGAGGFEMASLGVGGPATRGRGRPGDARYGRDVTRLGDRKPRPPVPEMLGGKPIVTGALDMETVRRIVRQHNNETKYCYEKQLITRPDLAGRVTVKFTIGGSGAVIAAAVQESTVEDRTLESCITDRIRRWGFPEPRGGGVVVVTYPFVFRTTEAG
jgi:TonB family protein